MAIVITAPSTEKVNSPSLFLAGGITGAPNWQEEVSHELNKFTYYRTIVNPRRDGDLAKTGKGASFQIQWEYERLRHATHILFWFPKEAQCPIALFELGKAIGWWTPVFVGVEPGFWREFDIREQLKCAHIQPPCPSLKKLVARTKRGSWAKHE